MKKLPLQKPERYARILEAATREFATKGFEKANVNAIADTVGIGKGTLYNYADSKEALFLETIRHSAAALLDYVQQKVAQQTDPLDRLRAFILADLQFMDSHPDSYELIASVFYGANVIYGKNSQFAKAVYAAYSSFFKLLERLLRDATTHLGAAARDLDAKVFMTFGLMESLILYPVITKKKRIDRERDATRIMTLLLKGVIE